MPGIATRQLARAGDGMRNFNAMIFGAPGGDNFFASALTGAPLTTLAVGDNLTMTKNGMPLPRSVTAKLVADGTVVTRTVTFRFYGRNQFGEHIQGDVSLSAAAGVAICDTTEEVFSIVERIEVIEISNMQAGDNLKAGLDVDASGMAPDDVIYGLPQKVLSSSDIIGGVVITAGAAMVGFDGAGATFVPGVHGVKLPAIVAPDAGADRLVILTCRTSWS